MSNRFNRTSRVRTARFSTLGSYVEGVVKTIADVPVPEFNSDGKVSGPKFDASGNVVLQPDVTILTADGEETVIHCGVGIQIAIAQALVTSELGDLRPDDILHVKYIGDEDADELTPAKVYQATITRGYEVGGVVAEAEKTEE